MFDQTESLCMAAGLAAIGAIWYSHTAPMHQPLFPPATECSARKADVVVSARAADTVSADSTESAGVYEDDSLWGMSEDGKIWAETHAKTSLPGGGAHTEATKKARAAVQPVLALETTYKKNMGAKTLVAGRAADDDTKKPKTSGMLFFNVPEGYADHME